MTSHRPLLASLAVALVAMAMAIAPARAEPEGPDGGETYALLVGVPENEGDRDTPRFAEADVFGLSEVLKEAFKVPADHMVLMTQRENTSFRRTPTRIHILRELDILLTNLREEDTVIVALAGQGVQFRGDDEPYFCPIDARLTDRSTLISLGEVRRMMERARAGLKLLFVDAGRNDPSDLDSQARGGLSASRIEEARSVWPPVPVPVPVPAPGPGLAPGTVISFSSCSRGERSFEDAQARHGIFFRHLIDGLRGRADLDEDGLGTLGELRTYVDRNVRNQARDQHAALQQPELVGNAGPKTILVAFKPASFQLRRAEEWFEKRKYDEVIRACTRLLQHDPRLAEAYHLRGKARILDRSDLATAAIADFTAALKYAPGLAQAHLDRGVLYLETGEPDRAIADFDGASRLGLSSPDVSFYRGMAHLQRGRFSQAVADFNEAIRADPGLAAAFLNRGVALFRQDLLNQALADYEKAIALDPRMARAYLNRGVVRMTLGDLDGAIADFDATLRHARRGGDTSCVVPALFDRGKAFFLKKDYPRAIADWERGAQDLVDRDAMTLDHLGLAYSRLPDEVKAARYFEDAVRLDATRSYAPAHAHLGAVRYNQKDFPGAVRECTAAIEIDKTLAEAYSTRSLAFQALKQPERARADAEQAELLRGRRQDGRRPIATRLR